MNASSTPLAIKISERSDQQDRKPMFSSEHTICAVDPEVWQAIRPRISGKHEHIKLIASKNYASPVVMEAQSSA